MSCTPIVEVLALVFEAWVRDAAMLARVAVSHSTPRLAQSSVVRAGRRYWIVTHLGSLYLQR
jgi:hypothetical protein